MAGSHDNPYHNRDCDSRAYNHLVCNRGAFAIIVAMFGGGLVLQLTIFLIVSLGMLVFTRPWAIRYINNTRTRTNYEGIIGKIVRITQDVDNISEKGCAVVNGQEWTVRSADDSVRIVTGSLAKIVDIRGVKLIVEKYEGEETL